MMRFIQGFLAAVGLIVIGGAAYVGLGLAPVATASAPLPFEELVVGIAGARICRNNCAVCHGLPGQEQTAIAKGECPKPPELFKDQGVFDDPVGDTYWKVANGIRLTGMPGFTGSLSSDQIWQVSLLLANADKVVSGSEDGFTGSPGSVS